MPRYTQVTPTFTPVDYQTRIAPLEQYKDEYDKRLDKIEEQGLLADAIGGLIDENTDPELMDIYRDYSNRMQQTAKDLLDSGDLRSSRQSLIELRRDYANKLVPIQQAFNTRAEAAKSYREQKAKDPTYIGTDPLEHGLKDYMNGKMPNDKTASGAALYTLGQNASKAASGREIRETAWALDRKLGNQFFTKIKQEGWSQDEVMYALENLAKSNDKSISEDARKLIGFINDTVSNIHSINDIDSFADKRNRDASDGWILRGVIDGIGYKQEEKQQKYDATMWLDKQIKEEQLKRLRGQNEGNDNQRSSGELYSGKNVGVAKTVAKATGQFKEPIVDSKTGKIYHNALEAYYALKDADKKYISQDEYDKQISELISNKGLTGRDVYTDPDVVSLMAEKASSRGGQQRQNKEEYDRLKKLLGGVALTDSEYNSIRKSIGFSGNNMSVRDILDVTENNWDYMVEQRVNKQNISNSGNSGLKNLQKDILSTMRSNAASDKASGAKTCYRTDNGLTPSGDAIKYNDDMLDDKKVESIDMTPFGVANNLVLITHSNGDRYLVPINYLINEGGSDIYNATIRSKFNNYLTGKQDVYDDDGNLLTIDDILTHYLDPSLHNMVANTQRLFGHNAYQPQGGTSKTYPTGDYGYDE